jgi:hypothetical protein
MQLLKYISTEERNLLNKMSYDPSLINPESYGKHSNPEKAKIINNILKTVIDGFSSFSAFVSKNKIRIQYDCDYNKNGNDYIFSYKSNFIGFGYITLDELQFGFKEN